MLKQNSFENMKRSQDFYFVIVVLFFEFIQTSQNLGTCRNGFTLRWIGGIKVNSLYTFESPVSFTSAECAELCYRRKQCKSANFLASNKTCQLNSIAISSLTTVYDEDAYYIGKENMFSVSIKFIHHIANTCI